ncbi:something about silencing protein 10-like [Orbicella faveolata]|uniref:something about silencing protein 10-like n=1 Tax=Orbicella faveolata TaxID=48498 RepID=UPI0009E4311A|nr:something about silencing protein 10-like [Orbicella faveolata]
MDEFKFKLKEVIEKLHPLVKMARAGQVPKEGADYLELKHQLYLNYCVNIGFYLLLKARQTSVRDHPVIERLVQYKKVRKTKNQIQIHQRLYYNQADIDIFSNGTNWNPFLPPQLKEVIEKLHPLVKMARAGQVPKEGADYLELKHQLYLNYCVNIGFYLLLKARQTSVRDHPVIERLVQYKKLITELEPLDEKLKPEIEVLLSRGQISSEQNALQEKSNPSGHHNKKRSKKLSQRTGKLSSLLGDDESDAEDSEDKTSDGGTRKTEKEGKVKKSKTDKKRKRKVQVEGKADAMDPLEYYEAVKLQKKKKKEAKEATFSFAEQRVADEEETGDGKRGITYEISQNKGLTAKKKKELRNPRVKHRRKFYKAQIKRKSQVLPVVNEQNRYGGEMTGIRSNLTRSIKIK